MGSQISLFQDASQRPLAERLRPLHLNDIVGQNHILSDEGPLGLMLKEKRLVSIILWGPPGCGKTTLARLLALTIEAEFEPVSAVASGVADLRKIFEAAEKRISLGQKTLLFIDEIHRFNRAQQDVLLPYVEDGTVILVGATTENPSFELNGALLSRCHVLVLKRLDADALSLLLERAEHLYKKELPLTKSARSMLVAMADGDGRSLLGMAEELLVRSDGVNLDEDQLTKVVMRRRPLYDKAQESHYNLMSALHKSLRGSDCDAALYWFCRMIEGGEDPRYIARRLTRFASEDIGLAEPAALGMSLHAWEAYERLGSPEGELALAELVIYLATAPKSNASYRAYQDARLAAAKSGSLMPPPHILNAPTRLMKDIGYGEGYAYDHDSPEAFSGQNYFPEGHKRETYYQPVERGYEREISKRLHYWAELRKKRNAQ